MNDAPRRPEHVNVSASELITIGVSDLDEALDLFENRMGLRRERSYAASDSLRQAWGLGAAVTADLVELSCKGYPFGRLRLAAYAPATTARVRIHTGPEPHDGATDIGCKAVDFYVTAPISASYEMVRAAGYETRSEPILHEVGETISEEFVFWGPDGVPLLFMVGHRHAEDQLRPGSPDGAFSEIATVSVVGEDIDRTRAFYEGALGLKLIVDEATPDEFLNQANELTGIPQGTKIRWLLYGGEGEASGKILVLHFDGAPSRRLTGRMRPGRLGFSMLTHRSDDLTGLAQRIDDAACEILTPPREVLIDGRSAKVMLAVGPNEELFEFVDGPF